MAKPLTLKTTGSGGGVSSHADLTNLNYTNAGHTGFEKTLSHSTPLIRTIDTISIQKADSTHDGYLAQGDFNTFNGKQNAIGFTPEDVSNKENTTIDTSTTKYPTVNLLKTGLTTKQDVLIYKLIEDDYEITLQNNIIVVQNTEADVTLEMPSIRYAYKKIFNIVNETDYKVTLLARYDDRFYNNSSSIDLTTKGESIEITAFKGWHILNKFIP